MSNPGTIQNKVRSFSHKLKTLIAIYNIPLEEPELWKKYFSKEDEHMNYLSYLLQLEFFDKRTYNPNDTSEFRLQVNIFSETFFRKSEYYFETKDLTKKKVLDVGCGWGMLSVWYALSGAENVYAIGYPFQIEFIDKLVTRAREKKVIDDSIRVTTVAQPLDADIKTIANLEPELADRIYYHDVFEHLPDDIFCDALSATFNTLKPGGKLISATHNTDNAVMFRNVENWWNKQENERLINQRTELIKKKVADISNDHLNKMVTATRGLLLADFEKSISDYKANKVFPPASGKLRPPVDLDYDYICENYISPPHIVQLMENAGFKSHCYAALMHSRRFVLFQPLARIFRKLFMNIDLFSKTVIFVGIKN